MRPLSALLLFVGSAIFSVQACRHVIQTFRPIAHTSNVPNRGEPGIRKALGQVRFCRKPRLPAIPRSRAHLTPEAYPRSSYALHTYIHLSLDPLPPERDSNDSLDTSKAPRRMDGSMLRRGDENRAVTPGKTMRAVRHLPSRFRERVSAHVRPYRTRTRPRMSREHVARSTSPARRPRAGSGNPTIGRVGTSATRISSRDSPASPRVAGRPLHPQPQRAGFGHRALQPRQGERLLRGPGPRQRGGVALQGASRSNAIGSPPLFSFFSARHQNVGASDAAPLTRFSPFLALFLRRSTRSSSLPRSWRTARTRGPPVRSWRSSPRRPRLPPGWKTRRAACTRRTTALERRRRRSGTSRALPSAFSMRPSSSTTTT